MPAKVRFLGLDVHAATIAVAVAEADSSVRSLGTIANRADVVDEAVRRVLRVRFALGLFEHPYPEASEVTSAVPEHRPLVREAAEVPEQRRNLPVNNSFEF